MLAALAFACFCNRVPGMETPPKVSREKPSEACFRQVEEHLRRGEFLEQVHDQGRAVLR